MSILPKEALRIAFIQKMSCVCKKNVKHDKNQKLVYFIFRVEASKVIEFLQNIRLCDTNLFWNLPLQQICHI